MNLLDRSRVLIGPLCLTRSVAILSAMGCRRLMLATDGTMIGMSSEERGRLKLNKLKKKKRKRKRKRKRNERNEPKKGTKGAKERNE